MASIEISAGAEEDYSEAIEWYAERSTTAAEGFEEELQLALDAILLNPDRYHRSDRNHRFYLLKQYPFQIVYRAESNRITIVAIAHTSRRPRYWRKR